MHTLPSDLILETLKYIPYEDIPSFCSINHQFAAVCQSSQGQRIIQPKQRSFREKRIDEFLNKLYRAQLTLHELFDFQFCSVLITDNVDVSSDILSPEQIAQYIQLERTAIIQFLQLHPEVHGTILRYITLPEYYVPFQLIHTDFQPATQYSSSINQIINTISIKTGKLYFSYHLLYIVSRLCGSNYEEELENLQYLVDKHFLLLNYALLPQIKIFIGPEIEY